MKNLLLLLLLWHVPALAAVDMQIKIQDDQIEKLDIKIGKLTTTHLIPLLYVPAKVVVPGNHELLISSTQPGLVVQLLANIGDKVEKGQILARINSPELVTLQREFLTAGSELNLSELEYRRDKNLLEEGVIADRRWQETQTLFSSKTTRLDTARQLLIMAGMSANEIKSLTATRKLSSILNIHAPISGVVLERMVSTGARLDIQAPLYRIADLSELWLEINIPQERLNDIRIGDQVNIENTPVTATISLLGQSINRENQTLLARAVINGKQSLIKAGQNVNVQIFENSKQTSFKISNSAIAQYQGHNYLFTRNHDGFTVTEINVLGKQDNDSIISGQLSGNELIAIKGSVALKAIWLKLGEQ